MMIRKIFSWIRLRLPRHKVALRILVGNAVALICGVMFGTWLLQRENGLTQSQTILLLLGIGIVFSLIMNIWLIHTILLPLRELRSALDQAYKTNRELIETESMRSNDDIHSLADTINLMFQRLDSRAQLMSALSERAITAQEEERKRIARLLHDDTVQALSYLIIQIERLESFDYAHDTDLSLKLARIRQLTSTILDELRKSIWSLRPSILDDLGLSPAIRWLARLQFGEAKINVDFDLPAENFRLPPHLETMLFRVTQEAVTNILRHSKARNVFIRLNIDATEVILSIEDDGKGFDVSTTQENAVFNRKLGLLGIQERTSLVNGTLNIESKPGEGTLVTICIPLEMNQEIPKSAPVRKITENVVEILQ